MSKLARTSLRPAPARGVLKTNSTDLPDTVNDAGGVAFSRDVKSELFTLAVSNLVGEDTFYEKAQARDERFRVLIAQATAEDPVWTAQLLKWLRSEGNLRSASIVGAIEYGRAWSARFDTDPSYGSRGSAAPRQVLASVMQRADEPGEALGYWLGRYGRPLPKWLKKALYDGARSLYTPYAVFKYDGQGQPVRFGDVVELSQGPEDTRLFKWLLDRRHGREEGDYGIEMLRYRRGLDQLPVEQRRAMLQTSDASRNLREAGMTWESVSGWIQGPMDAKVWEAVIPTMGYMALLRNLRNFDEAGVSDKVAGHVIARLTDPEQVAKSRQLPFRFLSAYKQVPSDRWKHPLGQALDLSFANIPQLGGKTLVLIDVSGSMQSPISSRSTVAAWEIAALFGIALARSQRQQATIVGFDHDTHPFELRRGANVLAELQRFRSLVRGGATYTEQAVRQYQAGHDRVVVISDEQQNGRWHRWHAEAGGVFASLPRATHAYTINVMGYADAHAPATGVRHGLAGLTDAVFKLMGALEARQAGRWPWEI